MRDFWLKFFLMDGVTVGYSQMVRSRITSSSVKNHQFFSQESPVLQLLTAGFSLSMLFAQDLYSGVFCVPLFNH
jgi:hypothetical protein